MPSAKNGPGCPKCDSSGPHRDWNLHSPVRTSSCPRSRCPEAGARVWSDADECGTDGRLPARSASEAGGVVGPCVFPEEGTRLWAETSAFWRMLDLVLASAMVPSLFVTLKSNSVSNTLMLKIGSNACGVFLCISLSLFCFSKHKNTAKPVG